MKVQGAPDLTVDDVLADPAKVLVGKPFVLSATVINIGNGGSSGALVRCMQSASATSSAGGAEAGTARVGPLEAAQQGVANPGSRAVAQCSLTAPSAKGVHHYHVCVEPPAGESATGNNCSEPIAIETTSGPDLVVNNFRAEGIPESGKLLVGRSFRLSASVSNLGDADYGETILRIEADGGEEVGTASVTQGGALELSIELSEMQAGTYYYSACVDAVPDEIDTSNNCAADNVRVRLVEGPELRIEPIRVDDDTLAPGQTFILYATAVNDGDSESAPTTLSYHRSLDVSISTIDARIGTDSVPELQWVQWGIASWAASRSRQSIALQAPSAEGTYYYGACVAAVGDEARTGNNCSAAVQTVVSHDHEVGDPDLSVEASTCRKSGAMDGMFTLNATVRNTGDEASRDTLLRYYRSNDNVVSGAGDDLELNSDMVEGLPKSKGLARFSLRVAAPSGPGGAYYGACVDAVDGDTNAGNNCSAAQHVMTNGGNVSTCSRSLRMLMEARSPTVPRSYWSGWRIGALQEYMEQAGGQSPEIQ